MVLIFSSCFCIPYKCILKLEVVHLKIYRKFLFSSWKYFTTFRRGDSWLLNILNWSFKNLEFGFEGFVGFCCFFFSFKVSKLDFKKHIESYNYMHTQICVHTYSNWKIVCVCVYVYKWPWLEKYASLLIFNIPSVWIHETFYPVWTT